MFIKAKPITIKETAGVMNGFTSFLTKIDSLVGAELHICAADFYRLSVNGSFVAFGPARTAKGYARMDRISLGKFNRAKKNELVISVAGYGCRSMSTVLQQMFLWAEIVRDGKVIAATGYDFDAFSSEMRNPKTARYSIQRHFIEEWDFRHSPFERHIDVEEMKNPPKVIERVAPYPSYADTKLSYASFIGAYTYDPLSKVNRDFYSFLPSERWGRYTSEEIDCHSYEWVQAQNQFPQKSHAALPLNIADGQYAVFDFNRIETGFLRLAGIADGKTKIVIAFSEDSPSEQFTFTDMHAHNVIDITAEGSFDFLSFEPYTLKYAAVFVQEGKLTINDTGIKSFAGDISECKIPDEITNPKLRNIYMGAMRSFAHNAVDLYTDCPSRERAGWLCDSYFTAKTEYCLRKSTAVEDAFLENYRLFRNEGEYPGGVLPMCYPSEAQDDSTFIPQWTMWYILEAEDYINNRGHQSDRETFRDSIYGLLDFYSRYENSDGLLERLPSWNFVEWSRANEWTYDVNYPTNFLYAEVLRCTERIFGDKAAGEKAERVAAETVRQSFDGTLFLDHSVRENGKLVRQADCSEAGQYYAVLFGNIDLKDAKYAKLYRLMLDVFGANRTTLIEEIAPINAFIGAYLRLESLLKMKENDAVIKSVIEFFGNMAEETETLWEYRARHGSRDHGFASYALVAMRRALGIDND